MIDKIQDVVEANEKFYRAIKSSDIDLLNDIWINDESVKCVHPGWPMLHGWEAVGQSWKNIFSSGNTLDIELQDVHTQVSGDSAWVICIEKISYRIGGEIQHGFAQSTNIFRFDGSRWLLALHHASPVPAPRGDTSLNEVLQ
jgi:ketosteroid isomerase-like protein